MRRLIGFIETISQQSVPAWKNCAASASGPRLGVPEKHTGASFHNIQEAAGGRQ
jgi:hypothetical protein